MFIGIPNRGLARLLLGVSIGGVLLLVALMTGGPVATGQAVELPEDLAGMDEPYRAGELLVQFENGLSATAAELVMEAAGASYLRHLYQSDVQVWQVPEGEEERLSAGLSREPGVLFAEPNYMYRVVNTPNDPLFGSQWAHQRANSVAGWDITTGSTGNVIAILDTGIDPGHPDLAGKIVAGYDFIEWDDSPRDLFGHGTHVSGIASAITNNGVGVAGMDWQARIMPVRVLNEYGGGTAEQVTNGINWASNNGAKVINMSLGGDEYSFTMQSAVNSAHANGVLVVAAMGNDRAANPTMYPAAYNNVLAVSATAQDDTYADYSQYGTHNDVAAPGGEMQYYHQSTGILSTMPTYDVAMTSYWGYSKNYDTVQGTSMAAPMVSGLAGLIWSLAPSLTPDQVQAVIEDTARDLGSPGWDPDYGHGLIDIFAALAPLSRPDAPVLNEILNEDGDGNYDISWNDVALAGSYKLEGDDNPEFNTPATIYEGAGTSVSLNDQPAGVTYYHVKAIGASGESAWSNVQSVGVVPDAPVLQPISNPGNGGDYLLEWSVPNTALHFELQEDDNPGFSSPKVRYAGSATQYELTGQDGGIWYYRVRAASTVGNSVWSNTSSTTVDAPPLNAPILLEIVNGEGDGDYEDYVVEWTPVAGATDYILEESAGPYFVNPTVIYSGNMTMTQIIDQEGGTWHYRVRASGDAGMSAWSNEEAAIVWVNLYLPVLLK